MKIVSCTSSLAFDGPRGLLEPPTPLVDLSPVNVCVVVLLQSSDILTCWSQLRTRSCGCMDQSTMAILASKRRFRCMHFAAKLKLCIYIFQLLTSFIDSLAEHFLYRSPAISPPKHIVLPLFLRHVCFDGSPLHVTGSTSSCTYSNRSPRIQLTLS